MKMRQEIITSHLETECFSLNFILVWFENLITSAGNFLLGKLEDDVFFELIERDNLKRFKTRICHYLSNWIIQYFPKIMDRWNFYLCKDVIIEDFKRVTKKINDSISGIMFETDNEYRLIDIAGHISSAEAQNSSLNIFPWISYFTLHRTTWPREIRPNFQEGIFRLIFNKTQIQQEIRSLAEQLLTDFKGYRYELGPIGDIIVISILTHSRTNTAEFVLSKIIWLHEIKTRLVLIGDHRFHFTPIETVPHLLQNRLPMEIRNI